MRAVVWLIGLALATSACALRQAAPTATLQAEVKDFATGQPVAGAAVRLVDAQQSREITTTDAAGRFAITRLGEKVTLELAAAGKAPLRRSLRLAPGEERDLDLFMVAPGAALPDDTILFERGGHVFRTDPAGLAVSDLTADLPGVHASPTWNADRTQFAFIQRIPGRAQVATRYADGSPGRFVGDVPDSTSQLRWNPEGRVLVFAYAARTPKGQFSELRAMDVFSGAHRDLVGGQEERDPAWSRDGRFLAWARLIPGRTWELWSSGHDGGANRILLASYNAREPAWSPDGKRVAFSSNREGDYNLYEMALEAPRPRRLTLVPPGGWARRPLYSPLGDEILFETNVVRGAVQEVPNLSALNLRTGRWHEVVDEAREAAW
ncbi:MAG: PD40 domain-containing protein [Candidatus Sericytochromatia bacterium]|nr:PD40 domain-containing protein [Candidatus Tanganyikabacteria bacterium]